MAMAIIRPYLRTDYIQKISQSKQDLLDLRFRVLLASSVPTAPAVTMNKVIRREYTVYPVGFEAQHRTHHLQIDRRLLQLRPGRDHRCRGKIDTSGHLRHRLHQIESLLEKILTPQPLPQIQFETGR